MGETPPNSLRVKPRLAPKKEEYNRSMNTLSPEELRAINELIQEGVFTMEEFQNMSAEDIRLLIPNP